MKKLLAFLLVFVMLFSFVACGSSDDDIKVGFIMLHSEQSTYDKNFIDAALAVQKKLGLKDSQIIIMKDIPEGDECKTAAEDLVDQGCDIVFADSFGHESFLLEVAKANPDVQFCHATGTLAHTAGLKNFHNAFASIYEGRYLAGVAAGMKLNEMIAAGQFTAEEAKMGYVGAFTYAEVISGYTSFYLGAKSVCPTVTMDVQFTGSWYDAIEEENAAKALIARGCKLISQHADSMGAPSACEAAGIPNVSYNGSTVATCENTFIVSSKINWAPYFEYIINCVTEGKDIDTDWTGTIATESVQLCEVNTKVAAAGTVEKLDAVKKDLVDGKIHVFDTKNFTKDGNTLTSYMADVNTDDKFTPDTEAIENGIFYESKHRSAPYFDIRIDNITLLNEKY